MYKKSFVSIILSLSMLFGQMMPVAAAEPVDMGTVEEMAVQAEEDASIIDYDTDLELSDMGTSGEEDTDESVKDEADAEFEESVDAEVVELSQSEEEVSVEEISSAGIEEALGAETQATDKDKGSSSSSKDTTKDGDKTVSANKTKLETQYVNVKKKVKIKIPGVSGKDKKRIVWSSSNEKFVQIKKGKAVGIARGMAEVHAVLDNMDYVTTVYVNEPKVRPGKKITMDIGETCYGTITGVLDQPIKWENKKPEVAQITPSGNGFIVVAKAKGSSKVTCQIGKKKYKINVKVGKGTYDNKQKIEWETEDLWPPVKQDGIKVPGERLFKCSNGTCYSRYFYNYGKYPYDPDWEEDDDDKDKDKEPKDPEKIGEDRDPGTPPGNDSVSSNNGVTISMNYVEPGKWVDSRNVYVTIDNTIIKPYGKYAYLWAMKGINPHKVDIEEWQATPNFTATANGTYVLWIKTEEGIIYGGEITIGNIDDESPEVTEEVITIQDIPTYRIHVSDLRSGIKSITITDPEGKKSSVEVPNGNAKKVTFDLYEYLTVPGVYTLSAIDHCFNETRVYYTIYTVPSGTKDVDPVKPTYDTYTVTYNSRYPNGTNETETQTRDASVVRYAKITDLNFSTPDGYSFAGWTEDPKGTGVEYVAGKKYDIASDKTVYGVWTLNSYGIEYELDGGVNDASNPKSFTIEDANIVLKDASKNNYDFTGWYTDKYHQHKITSIDTKSMGLVTLYAGFELKKYNIEYYLYGGTNSVSNPSTYTTADKDITLQDPAKKHYEFGGWYDSSEFKTRVYTIDTATADTVSVYAKFTPIVYSVDYKLDGGVNHADNKDKFTVSDNDIELKDPAKQNYRFEGWFTRFDLTPESQITKIDCSNGENRTIYAKFVKNEFAITKEEGYEGEYDGQAHSITVETSTEGTEIKYSTDEGTTWLSENPSYTAIGDYTVYYKLSKDNYEDYISSKVVSIKPINISELAQVILTDVEGGEGVFDYNGQPHTPAFKVELNGQELIAGQDYTYEYKDNVNAGTASLLVTGKDLYGGSVTKTFTINKVAPAFTAPQAKQLAYNEVAQSLVTAGTTSDGTVMYRLEGSESEQFTETLPKATNVGTYVVKWYVKGDRNHTDTEVASITVKIDKAEGQLTVAKSGFTYGTEPTELTLYSSTHDITQATITYTGNLYTAEDSGTGEATGEAYESAQESTNAGAYSVVVSLPETDNYKAVQKTVNYKVFKADGDITIPSAITGLVYDGTEHALITAGSSTTGTIMYKLNDGQYGTDIPKTVSAGNHTVYYKVSGTPNYKAIPESSFVVTVAKADGRVTLASTSGTFTYPDGGTVQITENLSGGELSATVVNSNIASAGIDAGALVIEPGTTAGKTTITVTSAATVSYNAASAAYEVTVQKGTLGAVTATDVTETYTGSAYYLSAATCETSGTTVMYGTTEGNYDYSDITDPALGRTNAGAKTVYWRASKAGYNDKTGSYLLTVQKADSSAYPIRVPASSLTYNGSAQQLCDRGGASGGVMYYGIGASTTSAPTSWSDSYPTATMVGTYYIWVKVVGDENHNDIAPAYKSSTIIRSGTLGAVTASSQTKTYNENAQYLDAVTCTTSGVTIAYGTSSGSYPYSSIKNAALGQTNAGTKTVYYKVSKTGYNDKTGSYTLTITKATPTMTLPTAKTGLVYNGSAQELFNAGSATGGDIYYCIGDSSTTAPELDDDWTPSVLKSSYAGPYYIWARVIGDSNYNDIDPTYACQVVISKANSSMTKPTAKTGLTYTGSAQALCNAGSATNGVIYYGLGTSTTSGPANTAWSTSVPTGTNVGTYYVWSKVIGNTGYNDVAAEYACTVTITAAAPSKAGTVTINTNGNSNGYSTNEGAPGALAAAVNGYNVVSAKDAGDYTYNFHPNGNNNDTVAFCGKANGMKNKTITVTFTATNGTDNTYANVYVGTCGDTAPSNITPTHVGTLGKSSTESYDVTVSSDEYFYFCLDARGKSSQYTYPIVISISSS